MKCLRIEKLLWPYLEGDLSPADRDQVLEHLEKCPDCMELAASFQKLDALLEKAGQFREEPPPWLFGKIMASLPARPASGFWSWRSLHPYLAAVSLILAVGLGFVARDMFPGEGKVPVRTQQVRIIFFSPEASSVALIGDFNEWGQREVTAATSTDRGIWEFTVALRPGVYHYNLLVDGERWLANPKSATLVPDGFGGYDSVLVVSEKCQDDCS